MDSALTLSFSKEDRLSSRIMASIAKTFMEKIGFGRQPWLGYRHFDAYQPHLHILTTTIKRDGHSLASEFNLPHMNGPVWKSIESDFGLRSQLTFRPREDFLQNLPPKKFVYGESEMQSSISVIVQWTLQKYNVTNLDELNAILGSYNVLANRGAENSQLRSFGGLYYHALGDEGTKVGTPIKASHLHGRPILKKLELKFRANALSRDKSLQRVRTWASWALRAQPPGIQSFKTALKNEQIQLLLPGDNKYAGPEVFYIDHKSMSVFGDQAIGAAYGYKVLSEKYALQPRLSLSEQIALEELRRVAPERSQQWDDSLEL